MLQAAARLTYQENKNVPLGFPAKKDLERAGVTIDGMSDHTVSQSLYLQDPDGNEAELYVDADEALWKNSPAAVLAPIKPLQL